VNTSAQYDLARLLEQAGARPPRYGRGKWACPKHRGSPSLSVDLEQGLFNCHHARCNFKGNSSGLARELGFVRRMSRAEYRRARENVEQADRASRTLFEHLQERRFDLLERLRAFGRSEIDAHRAGADHPTTWDGLARVYSERPRILTELTALENCRAADLVRLLTAGPEQRARMMDAVLIAGGVFDSRAQFVEILL
jgi:hypothetical protein